MTKTNFPENELRLLSIHAHPDDEASKGASTVSAYHDEGVYCALVCCTGGEEGDILFGDAVGSTGYRQDGAQVIILHFGDKFIRVGAFADNYTDIYNFDRLEKKLAWSSNKSGPLMGKVSVYESNCTAVY